MTMYQMQIPVFSKLPKTGTTIFSTMSQLAEEHQAINLSQGYPDFDCSPTLIDLVYKYMQAGHNQYAPLAGVLSLREQIAKKVNSMYEADVDPQTDVTITSGATQAIFTAITSMIREDDEVIVFEPSYDSYSPSISLNGGRPIYIRLQAPDFHIPWKAVKKVMTARTRMIIINTPHNPTGSILSAEDMEELHHIVKDNNILLLFDEVYEHMVFDQKQHLSVLKYPALRERSLVMYSFGKTFHNTGWKLGYCIAPAYLMKEFRKVHQYLIYCVNTPLQYALSEYLEDASHYTGIGEMYQEKRDLFLGMLEKSRFSFVPTQGTYFQVLDYSAISDEKDIDFAKRLTSEHKVASIPLSPFYSKKVDQQMLRFCFAKKEETLRQAAQILCTL